MREITLAKIKKHLENSCDLLVYKKYNKKTGTHETKDALTELKYILYK